VAETLAWRGIFIVATSEVAGMQSKVQKWGNSLAVRIPRAFALELGLRDDDPIDLTVREGAVVVAPKRPEYRLEELLRGVTKRNCHSEQDFGAAEGNEAW
jgi:antitoxin MazE